MTGRLGLVDFDWRLKPADWRLKPADSPLGLADCDWRLGETGRLTTV